jgi:hypothetical protein
MAQAWLILVLTNSDSWVGTVAGSASAAWLEKADAQAA